MPGAHFIGVESVLRMYLWQARERVGPGAICIQFLKVYVVPPVRQARHRQAWHERALGCSRAPQSTRRPRRCRWYTAKSALLYGLRFLIYRSKKQHYYMLEMCYYVNLVLLVYLWLAPDSEWLYKVAAMQPPPLPPRPSARARGRLLPPPTSCLSVW